MNQTLRKIEAAKKLTTTLHPDEFPLRYAMICDGKCLEPVYMDGCKLMFDREVPFRPGDFVILHRRPEMVQPGEHQLIVKKLVLSPGQAFWRPGWVNTSDIKPIVIVKMLNPHRTLYIDPAHLLGIHKCVGFAPDSTNSRILGDDEVRRLYGENRGGRRI